MKIGILADIHFHPWSLFSAVDADGVNSRLGIVIDEFKRAAATLKGEGGSLMVIAGDIFHARGHLDPEVLNPVRDAFKYVIDLGVDILVLPGNHDLKSRDTKRLSSAVQNLEQDGENGWVKVANKVSRFGYKGVPLGMVPWRETTEQLKEDLAKLASLPDASERHVFIHAGIDGVISGMPAHGLTAADLASYGFKGIYAGHYHNHADMSGGLSTRVMSIGATTHHNWGDVDTRAGFLILDSDTDTVTFHDTQAPKFIDISGMSETDMELEAPGNYVRFRGPQMTQDQINEFRDQLKKWGALGVSIEVPRAIVAARPATTTTGLTLDQSVDGFVKEMKDVPPQIDKGAIAKRAQEVLNDVRSVTTE